jgi:hypothetical protein
MKHKNILKNTIKATNNFKNVFAKDDKCFETDFAKKSKIFLKLPKKIVFVIEIVRKE